jgi:PAS domain S-box-containing protein
LPACQNPDSVAPTHLSRRAHLLTPELQALIAEKVAALWSEAGLSTILDGIGDGFYALDRDWRIILFNSEAARHFGRPREEMLGRILWDALPGSRETALGKLFIETMASRQTIRSETESVVFPGTWVAYRLFPLGDGLGVVFRDMTARRRAEAQRDLLTRELEHRIKNTLAIVQSIAAQTFRGLDPRLRGDFEARLITLSNVHGVLTRQSFESADLHEVIASTLRPHDAPEARRFTVEGPALLLGPKSAVAVSMAIHELCTNAIKYGALSNETGHVEIRWGVDDGRFRWSWREHGGPAVSPPQHRGFGTRMIEGALAAQLTGNVVIDFRPPGLICTIDAPLEAIRDSATLGGA